jgi:hypothetical protein
MAWMSADMYDTVSTIYDIDECTAVPNQVKLLRIANVLLILYGTVPTLAKILRIATIYTGTVPI